MASSLRRRSMGNARLHRVTTVSRIMAWSSVGKRSMNMMCALLFHLRKAEHALADGVAADFQGAATDAPLEHVEVFVNPLDARGVALEAQRAQHADRALIHAAHQ